MPDGGAEVGAAEGEGALVGDQVNVSDGRAVHEVAGFGLVFGPAAVGDGSMAGAGHWAEVAESGLRRENGKSVRNLLAFVPGSLLRDMPENRPLWYRRAAYRGQAIEARLIDEAAQKAPISAEEECWLS